jgi:hypothetical protein
LSTTSICRAANFGGENNITKQTSKAQLLKDIHTERGRLERLLSSLSAEDLARPGVTGNWSVKDLLAHLVAWEQLFIDWYQAGLKGSAFAITPVGMSKNAIHEINQRIYDQNKSRTLDDVLTKFHASYKYIVSLIEGIPEQDIFAHARFSWTGKLKLADYIAGNTCNHYAWAKLQIRKWAKTQGQ